MGFRRDRRDWDDLARLDPLWAIASTPGKQYGGWDEDAFAAGGRRKAERVMSWLDVLGAPANRARALDFGCGVGRLTIPFSETFEEVVGIDIAPGMLERAQSRTAEAGRPNVRYLLDEDGDLAVLADDIFDLVYSSQVLQHLPSPTHVARTLGVLARLVAPGGALIAQVPDRIGRRDRLAPGRRAYAALRALGMSAPTLYERLHVNPIRMTSLPRGRRGAARLLRATACGNRRAPERRPGELDVPGGSPCYGTFATTRTADGRPGSASGLKRAAASRTSRPAVARTTCPPVTP
jgi:SAM-dependent methyltransferase